MLRLFCSWRDDVQFQWPDWAYEVPEYEFLIETWRNPDPDSIREAINSACDRHVLQSYGDTNKTYYDFSAIPRTPVEILMLFRLRQISGLENPHIIHELLDPPFDRLPGAVCRYEPDELMQCTLARLREDWPDFDRVVSLESIQAR